MKKKKLTVYLTGKILKVFRILQHISILKKKKK